jgi:hypothetical protein
MARQRIFLDYLDRNGENLILEWLNSLPARAKAKINAVIRGLEFEPRLAMPDAKVLEGDCKGLFELRVTSEKVQYRPLCCYGPNRQQVTILLGAIEKGSRFEPLEACAIALRRKAHISDDARTCEHDIS